MNPAQKKILDTIIALRRHKADVAAYKARGLIAALGGLFLIYQEIITFSRSEAYVLTGLSVLPAIGLLLRPQSQSYRFFRYFSALFDSFLVVLFIALMALKSQPEYVAYSFNYVLFFIFLASTAFRADPWLPVINGIGNMAGYLVLYLIFAPEFDPDKFGLNQFRYDVLHARAMEIRMLYLALATILVAMINQFSKTELANSVQLFADKIELDRDLQLAANVQRSLFPSHLISPAFRILPHFESTRMIGGDFYDVIEMRDGHRGVFICDVSGHGVASALVAAALKMHIQQAPYTEKINPVAFLTSIENFINRQFSSHHLSAQYFYVNPNKKEIIYANAGHPYPIFLAPHSPADFLVLNGALLGLGIFTEESGNHVLKYDSGSRLIIYTDGLIESMNRQQEMYGMDRLLQSVRTCQSLRGRELIDAVLKDNKAFTEGLPVSDDLALVVLEFS